MVVAESVGKAKGFLNGARAALNVGEGDSCALPLLSCRLLGGDRDFSLRWGSPRQVEAR